MDAHDHVQVGQAIIVVFCLAYGTALMTNFRNLASRTHDQLRAERVAGRLYAKMPSWVFRAFGIWFIVVGVAQFFLLRYMP